MTSTPKIAAVFPKLLVLDVVSSLQFYRDVLGFRVSGSFDEPPVFGIVERDGCGLHLKKGEPRARRSREEAWDAYFEVHGIDVLAEEFRTKGASIARGPEHLPYGMKEFEVLDPDGYVICFAEDVGAPG